MARPTISDVAEYLQLRHNSTVELIDRAEHLGLVRRVTDSEDARLVRLQLTEDGDTRLKGLAHQHLRELERLAAHISQLWAGLD